MEIPPLTRHTLAAIQFGQRYLQLPLAMLAQQAASEIKDALARGNLDAASAAADKLAERAAEQVRWTKEVLDQPLSNAPDQAEVGQPTNR